LHLFDAKILPTTTKAAKNLKTAKQCLNHAEKKTAGGLSIKLDNNRTSTSNFNKRF